VEYKTTFSFWFDQPFNKKENDSMHFTILQFVAPYQAFRISEKFSNILSEQKRKVCYLETKLGDVN